LISYQRGDYAEAARRFEASELATASPELAMLMSNSLMFNGNYEEAIAVLKDTVLAHAPEWGAAYNNLGLALFNLELVQGKSGFIYSGLREFDQAIQYTAAQDNGEAILLAYTNKGDLLRRAGNWEDAESACRAALRSSTQSSSPYICLALYKLSRFAGSSEGVPITEIQDDLNNVKRFGTPPAKFYYLQAGLYRMQKQKQEALTDYEHFLEVMQDRACLEVDWSYIKDTARYITELKH
jgi:tetratricopeptide (TPR) repeat protein